MSREQNAAFLKSRSKLCHNYTKFSAFKFVSYCQNFHIVKAYRARRLVVSNFLSEIVLKAILKYKDHPSIKAIERVSKSKDLFNFSNVEKRKFFKKLSDVSKACQDKILTTKIIKENADIFTDFIHPSINASINNVDFP